ncbi:hypothetical protein AB433_02540 [Croceicoccus naphthovorans]|uniref:DUF1826 domain-containing protein n=1 Tax=Croceicoccus naphthovorans TaxID=1348774 RepID=A0A0G3XJU8_9SPHN|nr:hypothetical protein AB433_02540 [Croceicoccus naphthovorans]
MGNENDILTRIHDPLVQLAHWQRPRPSTLSWLDTLDWRGIDDIDTTVSGPRFGPQVTRLLHDAGYPQASQTGMLAEEIVVRASQFARLMTCTALRLRLEVIETDACRKFHMDYVTARLLMPLLGPGTQWKDANPGAAVNQIEIGNVCILKGRRWVDEPVILHRSPPIAGTGQTRLLLALDPANTDAPAESLRI